MMSTAARRVTRTAVPNILQPGRNCWRMDRANQFHSVQDAADYFRLVREALLSARKTVFVLGWDIFASVDLLPAAGPNAETGAAGPKGPALREAPTRLDQLLNYIARRRPDLHCYILIWDYAALYTLERDPWSRWRLGWRTHRHIHFGFDDRHPVGGSHHQKIVVVDDSLAFCGGIDLTGHRWDTSAHRVVEPARTSFGNKPYGPYHEVQAMVSGPAAASLGTVARDRWRALGEKKMPPMHTASEDLWPHDVAPDLTDVDVAIVRTVPGSDTHQPIREAEALFLDSIAAAKESIYIESQYFTNEALSSALAERLREPHGPEVVIVSPAECHGWLEQNTMCAFRNDVFKLMLAADRYKRLRLVYPAASQTQNVPTFVHSKVMVVDDRLVRIGSANFSRRSMAVDSECDLAVEATGDRDTRAGILRIRDRLIAEHLGQTMEAVARGIARAGSIRAFIDSHQRAEHTLVPIQLPPNDETVVSEAARVIADPEEPIAFGSTVEELVPPADATNGLRPLPLPTGRTIVLAIALACLSSAVIWRQEFQTIQDALIAVSSTPAIAWIATAAIAVAALAFVPVELLAIAAGLLLDVSRGAAVALLGSLISAAVGYAVGRAIGPIRLPRWMSRRSYRSARQLGARGVRGVIALRLASVATSGAIHLLCGAGRVPLAIYMFGTLIAFVPAITILAGLGALLRQTILEPTVPHVLTTVGAAIVLTAAAAILRTLLLIRQFAPSVSNQRTRAEFG
jgi:phospholipase D1/2